MGAANLLQKLNKFFTVMAAANTLRFSPLRFQLVKVNHLVRHHWQHFIGGTHAGLVDRDAVMRESVTVKLIFVVPFMLSMGAYNKLNLVRIRQLPTLERWC